ncbi:MAG: hypothetical protein RMJ31_05525 [Nitrososphaerota archaeon]|nr:hypothetical protein [Nitrososphaerales archaeon]MDW8045216.1 hypothetical protein [Nitrososphaerota archaeon]
MLEFEEQTIKVIIDDSKCLECKTKACIKGCSLYDRGILRLRGGKPAILISPEEVKRLGTECLACEYECWFRGLKAIRIEVPIKGLDEYKRKYMV